MLEEDLECSKHWGEVLRTLWPSFLVSSGTHTHKQAHIPSSTHPFQHTPAWSPYTSCPSPCIPTQSEYTQTCVLHTQWNASSTLTWARADAMPQVHKHLHIPANTSASHTSHAVFTAHHTAHALSLRKYTTCPCQNFSTHRISTLRAHLPTQVTLILILPLPCRSKPWLAFCIYIYVYIHIHISIYLHISRHSQYLIHTHIPSFTDIYAHTNMPQVPTHIYHIYFLGFIFDSEKIARGQTQSSPRITKKIYII